VFRDECKEDPWAGDIQIVAERRGAPVYHMLAVPPAMAQQVARGGGASSGSTTNGSTIFTPTVRPELPIEIETELVPAASLKQAPLWHELAQIQQDPSVVSCLFEDDPATPGTDESAQCFANIVRRPSFDQPGPLFGPDDGDPLMPITDVIGRLVVDAENNLVVERNEASRTRSCLRREPSWRCRAVMRPGSRPFFVARMNT
jgi:hypothetical protein